MFMNADTRANRPSSYLTVFYPWIMDGWLLPETADSRQAGGLTLLLQRRCLLSVVCCLWLHVCGGVVSRRELLSCDSCECFCMLGVTF